MYKNKSVSVVIPAYNEEQAIKHVVTDLKKLKIIDEIIVINNCSTDSTKKIALKAGAKVIDENKQGFGRACITGLKNVKSDLIVLTEGDHTFDAKDILLFVKYIDRYDLVLGNRMIGKSVRPKGYIRFGNYLLSKLIEILWNKKLGLTDVGCTYRMIRKTSLDKIISKISVSGPHFTPESTIEILKAGIKIKQIPVKNLARKGYTKLSKTWFDSIKIGILYFGLILRKKFF